MDKWLEPRLPKPTPSFQEHGLQRHGVLLNMAPLGVMPVIKLKKGAKAEAARQALAVTRESTPVEAPNVATVTPEPTAPVSRLRSDSAKVDDADYEPKTTHTVTSARKSAPGRSPKRLFFVPFLPKSPSPERSRSKSESKSASNNIPLEKIVESARRQALAAGRYPTQYAIQKLFEKSEGNERMLKMIETAYLNPKDIHQTAEFQTIITYFKQLGRHSGEALEQARSMGNGTPTINAPSPWLSHESPSKNTTSGVAAATLKMPSEARNSPRHLRKSPQKSPQTEHAHVAKKQKSNDFMQRSIEPSPTPSDHRTYEPMLPPPDFSSSTSSLSSLDEEIIREYAAPSMEIDRDHDHDRDHDRANTPTTSATHARSSTQPTKKAKSVGPKLHTFPTNNNVAPVSSSPSSSVPPAPVFHNKKRFGSAAGCVLDRADADIARRKKASSLTNSAPQAESSIRTPMAVSEEHEPAPIVANPGAVPVNAPAVARSGQILRFRTGQAKKNEAEVLSSPTVLSFQGELPGPPYTDDSRAGTPNAAGRPSRKTKPGLRIKSSYVAPNPFTLITSHGHKKKPWFCCVHFLVLSSFAL